MKNKILPIILMLISIYFIFGNRYLGISLIILIASSIYFGYVIKEGKGKGEVRRNNLPPPQPLNISVPSEW